MAGWLSFSRSGFRPAMMGHGVALDAAVCVESSSFLRAKDESIRLRLQGLGEGRGLAVGPGVQRAGDVHEVAGHDTAAEELATRGEAPFGGAGAVLPRAWIPRRWARRSARTSRNASASDADRSHAGVFHPMNHDESSAPGGAFTAVLQCSMNRTPASPGAAQRRQGPRGRSAQSGEVAAQIVGHLWSVGRTA